MAIAPLAPPKPKTLLPEPQPYQPSFASPQVQTAPDVRQSAAIAGNAPAPPAPQAAGTSPTVSAIPNASTTYGQTGGTPAPAPTPTVTSAPAAATTPTVTAAGAPPGLPQTTPAPVAPTPQALLGRNAAANDLIQAENKKALELYEAALKYSGGPTSELAQDTQRAIDSLRGATGARGAAGTINSSLFEGDKSRIATAKAVADTKAYNTYQTALNAANDAWAKAQIAWQRADQQEKKEIAEAVEKREQTQPVIPPAPGGGPAGTEIVNGLTVPIGTQTVKAGAAANVPPKTVSNPNGSWVRIGGRRR